MPMSIRKPLLVTLIGLTLVGVVVIAVFGVRDPSLASIVQRVLVAVFLGSGVLWIGRVVVGLISERRFSASLGWRLVFGVLLATIGLLYLRGAPGSPGFDSTLPPLLIFAALVAVHFANKADRRRAGRAD